MPRLPQLRALFGAGRPPEIVGAVLGCQRLHRVDLLCNPGIGAVKLEEQRRRDPVVELRILVDGVDLGFVEQLDSRHRHAALDRQDHRVDGGVDRWEGAHRSRDRVGNPVKPHRHLGNDPERALRADEQPS